MKKWGNHLKELHNRLKEEGYQHIRFRNRVRMVMVIIIFDVKGKRILFDQSLECDGAFAHLILTPFL